MDERLVTVVWFAVIAAMPIVCLFVMSRPHWSQRRAQQTALRAGPPLGSDALRTRVANAVRARATVNMWAALLAIVAYGAVAVVAPAAANASTAWLLLLVLVCGVFAVTGVVYQTRHPLFTPPTHAVRVAHVRRVRTAHYLGRTLTALPRVLLALAAVGTAVVVPLAHPTNRPLIILVVCFTAALIVSSWTLWMEHHVLAAPQAAGDALELAWDDLFRANTVNTLRMAAAMASSLPVGALLMTAISSGASAPTTTAFTFVGIPFVQLVYLAGADRVRPPLRPTLTGGLA
ncbi:hypothetical protein ET475_17515 [Microbacterium protaetiae]|uniref:Uncharacterized protein n=1 Tax=Microbacterium protaetiae TaxID=2509458 RepID=A0A4P6EU69_9MICO|nr:hypothetical protein [Microbacterium protaetiae]QAY61588.1 hypothetical protein ET475_17515 [Microbacterium protaetiae]